MRTAMDIIVRDVRRSGYNPAFEQALPVLGASGPASNPYSPAGSMSEVLEYTYADIAAEPTKPKHEARGFKREGGIIKIQLGAGNWQPLTDGDVVDITDLTAEPTSVTTYLPTANCGTLPCAGSNGCGDARIVTRVIKIVMKGTAAHDPHVKRTLETAVRVRNDEVCL
jgi:hypothetical protein